MIKGIHHTAISTGDLERSVAFYRDLLGFKEAISSEWEVGTETLDKITGLQNSSARMMMLKAGNAFVEIFQFKTPSPKSAEAMRPVCDHGITHLCLAVTDVDAEYERLKAAGMIFHCPPQTTATGNRVTYGRDPDGNAIELLQVLDSGSPMALKVE
jgi:catechol 2,3-dioxygenase-like lactoylglutathione lyase family enzyme